MNDAYAASGARGGFYQIEREAALDLQLARSSVDGTEFIFDVQGHFVNPTGAWLKRLPPGAKPLQGFTSSARCEPHKGPGRVRLPALHRARSVRQRRVHGFRYRSDGAVVRPLDSRRRTVDDRGSSSDGAHRRAVERHASPAAAWPRQSEPAGRSGSHGRARSALQDLRLEDVHAMGSRRHRRIFHGRRPRHSPDRKGAQARHPQHRDSQGTAVRSEVVRALDLRRYRSCREAVSRTSTS